jgi:phosphotriesterase-related protein
MATINSVLGPIDTAGLGFTLAHEHVLETSAGIPQVYPDLVDSDAALRKGIQDLKLAHDEGVRTIIDVTTIDLGRDVRFLEQVSRESGVQIVCATGVWLDIPRAFWKVKPEEVASLFIREIEEGMEGKGIKAGIIKVANDRGGVTPEGEIILRAAAIAHKATGVPISTHTYAPERVGDQQARIFEDEGVDLSRVYVGHSDNSTEMGYLTGLAEKGAWLGLDMLTPVERPGLPNWEQRTETAWKLIEAGYAHRVMLSHDWSVMSTLQSKEDRERRHGANPDGYLFVTRKVLPKLRELGASQDVIQQIMVDNPRRFFEGS